MTWKATTLLMVCLLIAMVISAEAQAEPRSTIKQIMAGPVRNIDASTGGTAGEPASLTVHFTDSCTSMQVGVDLASNPQLTYYYMISLQRNFDVYATSSSIALECAEDYCLASYRAGVANDRRQSETRIRFDLDRSTADLKRLAEALRKLSNSCHPDDSARAFIVQTLTGKMSNVRSAKTNRTLSNVALFTTQNSCDEIYFRVGDYGPNTLYFEVPLKGVEASSTGDTVVLRCRQGTCIGFADGTMRDRLENVLSIGHFDSSSTEQLKQSFASLQRSCGFAPAKSDSETTGSSTLFTLRCETSGNDGRPAVLEYTFSLTPKARYYSWSSGQWDDMNAADEDDLTLINYKGANIEHYENIDRNSGDYLESSIVGRDVKVTTGTCERIGLRHPPSRKF